MKPTVIKTSETQAGVTLHADMGDPSSTFYADRLEVLQIPLGKQILAVRTNPYSGEREEAIEIVMEQTDFDRFVDSLNTIAGALRSGVPADYREQPTTGVPTIVGSAKAFVCYAACSNSGISLDFFAFAAIQLHRMAMLVEELPQLVPIVRVELLPGRLHHLLTTTEER